MAKIERSTELDVPASAVWTVLKDITRLPELSPSTVEVRDAPTRPLRAGDQFVQVISAVGRKEASTWTVLEVDPGRCLVMEGTVRRGVRYWLRQAIDPVDADRSRVTITVDYQLPFGVLGKLADHLGVERRSGAELDELLRNLRAVVDPQAGAGNTASPD